MNERLLLACLGLAAFSSACQSGKDTSSPSGLAAIAEAGALEPNAARAREASSAAVVEPFAVAQDSGLAQDVERRRRELERGAFLADEYVRNAERAMERADFQGAVAAYADALDIDPANQRAREGLRRALTFLGDGPETAAGAIDDDLVMLNVKRQLARMEADAAASRGDALLREGRYAEATEAYREAQTILKYNPTIAKDSLDLGVVEGKLASAVQLGQESEDRRLAEARAEAEERRTALEREQRENHEKRLQTLYESADRAFAEEDYEHAVEYCEQILLEDPRNEAAAALKEIAQSAYHQTRGRDLARDYREEWLRTFEDLGTMSLPQVRAIEFDRERWKRVSERGAREFRRLDAKGDSERSAVVERLSAARIVPAFGADGEGSPLEEVASYLQNVTNVNFFISPAARELDEEETAINLTLPGERSVLNILSIIADTKEELRWKIEDGVVKFVTKEEMTGGQVLDQYEVRDLITPVRDFPGKDINVSPSGGLILPEEDIEERESNVVTADQLDALIRNNIAPASWDEDPANSLRITELGNMVVYQTPEVHEQIRQLLADLREATGIMVDIQARFLTTEDNFLEDIGVDFRGLGQPGQGTNEFFNDFGDPSAQGDIGSEIGQGTDLGAFLDEGTDGDIRARAEQLYDRNLGDPDTIEGSGGASFQWTYLNDIQLQMILRAVSKSERVELVTAPRVLVFNTGRANLTVLNQVAYVSDFNVEIAQAASIADPIVSVIQDGVILDVRPVVSADRRFITLEMRPTIAQLRRPIREVVTTLGSQNSVTIQLPEVDIQRVRTSIPMPDGSTVLLGGLKVSQNQDQASGVPILNKIPIVSFLFERKGTYLSHRKLLILLKASIVIPEEHEPTPAQLGF